MVDSRLGGGVKTPLDRLPMQRSLRTGPSAAPIAPTAAPAAATVVANAANDAMLRAMLAAVRDKTSAATASVDCQFQLDRQWVADRDEPHNVFLDTVAKVCVKRQALEAVLSVVRRGMAFSFFFCGFFSFLFSLFRILSRR